VRDVSYSRELLDSAFARFLLICFLCLGNAFAVSPVLEQKSGAKSLRLEIEGVGVVIAKAPAHEGETEVSQLLLEKPGGMVKVIATCEGIEFCALYRADLSGNGEREIVIIARSKTGEDFMPYIYEAKGELRRIFPKNEEDNSIIGKEITLVVDKNGDALCVKELVNIHDYGPPDLLQSEYYRLQAGKLVKIKESIPEGKHFNQALNLAGLIFQNGDYLNALKRYEKVYTDFKDKMPRLAIAETFFYQAESRKFLKDFSGAISIYKKIVKEYPESPQAGIADTESRFLSANLGVNSTLSLYMDVSKFLKMEKWSEALNMLDCSPTKIASGPMADHLMFLRGEALVSLGKVDEAIKVYKLIKSLFPNSALIPNIDTNLQELMGNPDESQGTE